LDSPGSDGREYHRTPQRRNNTSFRIYRNSKIELSTLKELGLKVIQLDYKFSNRTDQYGNEFKYRAKVKDTHDAQPGRWAWDVFLVGAGEPQ
jgi:hypothetical protein